MISLSQACAKENCHFYIFMLFHIAISLYRYIAIFIYLYIYAFSYLCTLKNSRSSRYRQVVDFCGWLAVVAAQSTSRRFHTIWERKRQRQQLNKGLHME